MIRISESDRLHVFENDPLRLSFNRRRRDNEPSRYIEACRTQKKMHDRLTSRNKEQADQLVGSWKYAAN